MALKADQLPAPAHEQRFSGCNNSRPTWAKAILAEEQRQILRDLARAATELADSLSAQPPTSSWHKKR